MTLAASKVLETSFPAMGSSAHVMTVGGDERLLRLARREIGRLESIWSRFIPTSELSRLNRDGSVVASEDTCDLVERMIEAWRATGGRFDPTLGSAMEGIGYDRPFATGLDSDGPLAALPSDGCEDVVVDRASRRIIVPPGIALDPGGMGKGFAADLVAARLFEAGAAGVLVNLGGDLKVLGEPPVGVDWRVEILEESVAPHRLGVVALPPDAALATSTPLRRAWRRGDVTAHHLLDPRTGLPMASPAHLVSVVAADAWWAEATTKQLISASPDEARGIVTDAAALMVTADGVTHLIGPMEEYLA